MSYYVKIRFRDDKVKEYKCNERPSCDSFWTYLYFSPGKYKMERSETIIEISVDSRKHS